MYLLAEWYTELNIYYYLGMDTDHRRCDQVFVFSWKSPLDILSEQSCTINGYIHKLYVGVANSVCMVLIRVLLFN